ncbi:envelope glycoprotein O [Elephant endotheliotropic herpesvirus 3A]|uniref:Envelope glycoprotein O n=1 Tax=Elephant endotheliotropic herpesvirus 3A TaxID=1329409 RepID=A0A866VSW0_9BETA|nr:envelope glycoprotein O [Elephant endotheliotropic herpesvirus 3A]QOE74438.1 envelope glycoprotein O [Elephant endotheliotropic herpesvirus 3A]
MALSEALTDQFARFLNSSAVNARLPYYYPIKSRCNFTNPETSFIQCYIHVTSALIYSLNKHTFNCTNTTVKNVYDIKMPGASILVPLKPKCYSDKVNNTCDLEITFQDMLAWLYRQVIIVEQLQDCHPWQYVRYVSDHIIQTPLEKGSAFVNATYEFIDSVVKTNVSMRQFLVLTIASLMRAPGPACPPTPGVVNLGSYMNRLLKPEGIPP